MRFKCSKITIIVIVLIILLLSPMFLFHKQSPYMLMEGMKNKSKEGLASKTTLKQTKEGFSNIKGSNNPFSMLFFKDTKFKPQCCPSSYSNSMGCACINQNQYQYLITRGGNNVPFSQW